MVAKRAGFGLVEVIVAMTLLAIGIMSVSAGAAFSSSVLRMAENHEDASRLAESVVDSIEYTQNATSGSREDARFTIRWDVSGETLNVTVSQRESGTRLFSVSAIVAPVLDTVPCASCDE